MGLISSLSDITNAVQSYVVAPLAAFGVGGFLFNAQGESVAHLSADITDHYTEQNRALQDHIAIKPKRITLKGYVGELVYNAAGQDTQSNLASVAQKLTVVNSYLPQLAAGAQFIQSAISDPSSLTLDSALSSTSNIYGLVKNIINATTGINANQQNAYTYFKSLMETATLMGVQTPWEFMTSMAIESITAIQDERSIFITDFSITLKQIRIATVKTTAYGQANTGTNAPLSDASNIADNPVIAAPASIQAAPTINNGSVPGVSLPSNSLPSGQSTITGAASLKNSNILPVFSIGF